MPLISENFPMKPSFVWKEGTTTITLPNQLEGFLVAGNNKGNDVINISTPDDTTIPLNPSESFYFIGSSKRKQLPSHPSFFIL